MEAITEEGTKIISKGEYMKSNLKLGRDIHKAYKADIADGTNYVKEYRLPSGKKIDFLDIPNKTIYELKPQNPQSMRAGDKQLQMYLEEINKMPRFKNQDWKTVLETYNK